MFQVVLTFGVLLTAYLLASLVGRGFDEEVLQGVERFVGRGEGVVRRGRVVLLSLHQRRKGEQMRTESFSLVDLDLDDVEAVELRWNRWVRDLFAEGYRPADHPVSWTDTEVTYTLVPVDGINDYNHEHQLVGAA